MPLYEIRQGWDFLSTGPGTAVTLHGGSPSKWTWIFETYGSSRSTATIQVQAAIDSTGNFANLSSTSMSSASATVLNFTGPYACIRPYVSGLGSTGAAGSTGTMVRVSVVGV